MADILDDDSMNAIMNEMQVQEWEDPPIVADNSNDIKEELQTESANEPTAEHLAVLKMFFGHHSFRPMQWQIISSLLNERRDNCAIMATGYGKSLCYQFPCVYNGGITFVISPLISLMEDQILSLQVAKIPACLLGTAQTKQKEVIEDILEDKYSLIYLTPEFAVGDNGKDLLKKIHSKLLVSLIAIDEAHCVSSWGHDFRHQYRNLGELRALLPGVPVLAVTATATKTVQLDIVSSLKLKDPQFFFSGFDRPNLYIEVYTKGQQGLFSDLYRVMERRGSLWTFTGPTIIYCLTRNKTEEVAAIINGRGIECLPYHAGLPLKQRKEAHEKFLTDQVKVVAATVAFGMGIDKPDVRCVVHYGCPNSIESYYQEIGRAGRDGLPARCVLFYSAEDFVTLANLREATNAYGGPSKARKKAMTDKMVTYVNTSDCRRAFILSYFDDDKNTGDKPSMCCNNCTSKKMRYEYEGVDSDGFYNFAEDAHIFLSAVQLMQGRYGVGMYVFFVRGSHNSKMSEKYQKHVLHGSGKHKSETWWKEIGSLLEREGHLEKIRSKRNADRSNFAYHLTALTDKGVDFLDSMKSSSSKSLKVKPSPAILNMLRPKYTTRTVLPQGRSDTITQSETSGSDGECTNLYQVLLKKREELALAGKCMPFAIIGNKGLWEMAKRKPVTVQQFRDCELDGFSEIKLNRFVGEFIKAIRSFLELDEDSFADRNLSISDALLEHQLPANRVGLSAETSYAMYLNGKTPQEIAQSRSLVVGTVVLHLCEYMRLGYPIKLATFGVFEQDRPIIMEAVRKSESRFLSAIKARCPSHITFDQIKAVLSYMEVRNHLIELNIKYKEFEDFPYGVATTYEPCEEENSNLDRLLTICDKLETEEKAKKEHEVNRQFSDIMSSPPRSSSSVKLEPFDGSLTSEIKIEDLTEQENNQIGLQFDILGVPEDEIDEASPNLRANSSDSVELLDNAEDIVILSDEENDRVDPEVNRGEDHARFEPPTKKGKFGRGNVVKSSAKSAKCESQSVVRNELSQSDETQKNYSFGQNELSQMQVSRSAQTQKNYNFGVFGNNNSGISGNVCSKNAKKKKFLPPWFVAKRIN